ncbi:hypothetical protein [Campylobacter lanienae]|uniref:hypothetical protein n=1 Tax=Campylobacter lanienae TaxID=75658 RepID=UPI000BB42FEA|nr:hypothetical protein [Campylobacter lanienae]
MLLSGGILKIKDIDGNVVSGVSGNYFNLFSATFTTCGQVIKLPSQAVGKKGFLTIKTTCTGGFTYKTTANGAALNRTWWGIYCATHHYTGEVAIAHYDIATLPSTMQYEEYNTGSANAAQGWYDHGGNYKLEIKIYY